MTTPTLRGLYDTIAKAVLPRVEATIKSSEYATATRTLARFRRKVGGGVEDVTARLLHLANIPAGSDIKKLRRQVGELDYEIRQLSMRLETPGHNRLSDNAEGVSDGGTS